MLLTIGLVAASPSGQKRLTAHVIADIKQQIHVFLAAVPMFEAVQDFGEPVGSFATGGAFAARFVAVKLAHAQRSVNHTGVFVHDNYAARTSHRTCGRDSLEVERRIQFIWSQHRC